MTTSKFACPCCAFRTLDESPPGTFQVCAVCFWEDDAVQFEDPTAYGANAVSLLEAKRNFAAFGAVTDAARGSVRAATTEERA